MSGYNPQRSRSRPHPADVEQAPVDAILGGPAPSESGAAVVATLEPTVGEDVPVDEIESASEVDSAASGRGPIVEDVGSVTTEARGMSRLPMLIVAAVAAVGIAAVLYLRRRRNRPAA